MKKFNTAGPSVASMHFMIDPLVRIDVENIESLVEDHRYFVLHAPRQTGKTTCLLALMHHLNTQGHYRALYVNVEAAQAARGNVAEGMAAIVRALASAASVYWKDTAAAEQARQVMNSAGTTDWLRSVLEQWASSDARPIVLFLDEVDALVGDTLISLLRQIRAGYAQRPGAFPQSIVLCGVRDYRIHTAHHEIITGGSAFNIKAARERLIYSRTTHLDALADKLNEAQGFLGEVQRIVLELKLWKKGRLEAVLAEGQPQTVDYARQCGANEAHLIVFDRRPDAAPWDERIWQRNSAHDGQALGLWGA